MILDNMMKIDIFTPTLFDGSTLREVPLAYLFKNIARMHTIIQ